MRSKLNSCRLLLAALLISVVGCVDKDFNIQDTSTEVTIGQGTTTVPIGYIEKKRLADLIGEDNLEGLSVDPETGDYSLSFNSEESSMTIKGVDSAISLPRTENVITLDYPQFSLMGEPIHIDEGMELNSLIGGMPLPEVEFVVPAGHTIAVSENEKVEYTLEYDLPDAVQSVNRIYLAANDGEPGARVDAVLKFHDVNLVNDGGYVDIRLEMPKGYEVYDDEYNLLEDGIFEISNYEFEAGQSEVKFTIYIASIENSASVVDGHLSTTVGMEYTLAYSMTTKSGLIKIKTFPELHIISDLAFCDAEVVLGDVKLLEDSKTVGESVTIDNVPEAIKSIKQVELADAEISLFANGLDWIADDLAKSLCVEATLPEYLVLKESASLSYNAATHTLSTSLYDMRKGIALGVESLTFDGEGLVPVDGVMKVDFNALVKTGIKQGTVVRLSDLKHDGEVTVHVGFDECELSVNSVSGVVDYYYDYTENIEIGNIDGLVINDIGLSPVIFINIESDLSIETFVTLTLVPIFGDLSDNEKAIKLRDVSINGAQYVDGELKSGATHLIIADESHRADYTDDKYTFVPCDISSLFSGGALPNKISLSVEFETNNKVCSTLYAAEEYRVAYSFGVDMPIAFDNTLDIVYSDTLGGLSDTFAELAEQDIKVGDVALIAEITNTTPLGFEFDAELVDADGNPSGVKVSVADDMSCIKGSPDGKSEIVSPVRIELELGDDGAVSRLAEVDGLRFTLKATSAADGSVALNENQYVSLKLQAELSGGITLDINSLIEGDEENQVE